MVLRYCSALFGDDPDKTERSEEEHTFSPIPAVRLTLVGMFLWWQRQPYKCNQSQRYAGRHLHPDAQSDVRGGCAVNVVDTYRAIARRRLSKSEPGTWRIL